MRKYICTVIASLAISFSAFAVENRIEVSQLSAGPNPVTNGNTYVITGTATNMTDKAIKSAFITFNLYDEQGNLVGNAIATAQGLDPRGTWKFKADAVARFATYKISEINIFDN